MLSWDVLIWLKLQKALHLLFFIALLCLVSSIKQTKKVRSSNVDGEA